MNRDQVAKQNIPSAAPAVSPRNGRRKAPPLWLLVLLYITLIAAPLGFAVFHRVYSSPSVDTLASSLGLVAFAALLVDFLFSGRTRWISERIGIRRTMRIHRWVAYVVIACIGIHPFLYTAPDGISWPWFNAADPMLTLNHLSLFTGLAAWILTAAIVFIAVDHKHLPGSYRTWRVLHAGSALLLGALIAVHAISSGGHSSEAGLAAYWILLLSAGLLMLIEMFLVQPWQQRRARRSAADSKAQRRFVKPTRLKHSE